jgi:hypothetical protein
MPLEIGSVDGILGDRDSVLSDSGFGFDSVCISSKAYCRAVARTLNERVAGTSDEPALPGIKEDEEGIEDEKESESQPSEATAVHIAAPEFVEIGVHQAVCARLRDAEGRIPVLEALLQQRDLDRRSEAAPPPVSDQGLNDGPSDDARELPLPQLRSFNEPRPMPVDGVGVRSTVM